jgi:hypothetical protein
MDNNIQNTLSSINKLYDKQTYLDMYGSTVVMFIFLTLFFWVIAHYLWIGTDSQVQLQELASLWLRVLGGVTMAIATGIFLQKAHHQQNLLIISLFSIPVFTISIYLYGSYKSNHFLAPNNFVTLYLFNKVNTAFFSTICVAICCGSFLWELSKQMHRGKNNHLKFALLGVLIALTSAILASSKNGVGISLILLSLAVLCGLYLFIRNRQLNINYAI